MYHNGQPLIQQAGSWLVRSARIVLPVLQSKSLGKGYYFTFAATAVVYHLIIFPNIY